MAEIGQLLKFAFSLDLKDHRDKINKRWKQSKNAEKTKRHAEYLNNRFQIGHPKYNYDFGVLENDLDQLVFNGIV